MSRVIAITGATGFAGRHAVSELLNSGAQLRALARNPEKAGLPDAVETVKGDLSDQAALKRLLDGAHAVVHLPGAIAALDRPGYFTVNGQGTEAVVKAALAAGTPRFVHISSLSAREPHLSPYAASKRAGEAAVEKRARDLNAIIIRPPAVYGPGDKGTLPLIKELTRGVAAIPGRPEARFSLIHGRDLARIIAAAAGNAEQGLHEVSDGKRGGYGWAELIEAASAFRGRPVKPIFLPRAVPQAVAFAAEGLARLSGRPGLINRGKIAELYHPDWVSREGTLALPDPIPFAEGFAETVNWYRAAGWLPQAAPADRSSSNSRTR